MSIASATGFAPWGGEPKFMSKSFKLNTLSKSDEGVVNYGDENRKDFLESDGRTSMVADFSKWDRIVQANKICETLLNVDDLSRVEVFQEAYSHFTE